MKSEMRSRLSSRSFCFLPWLVLAVISFAFLNTFPYWARKTSNFGVILFEDIGIPIGNEIRNQGKHNYSIILSVFFPPLPLHAKAAGYPHLPK